MSKRVLAVFDSDLGYVERFLKYLKTKRGFPFGTAGFSELSCLEEFLQRNAIDILLVSDTLLPEVSLDDLLEHPGISEILVLGDKQDLNSRQKYLNKYRSCDRVINDVLTVCRMDGMEEEYMGTCSGILGIYSPVSGIWRSLFAKTVAEILGNDRNVLYLNLDRFPPFVTDMQSSGCAGLSDLIYYFKTHPKKIREMLPEIVFKDTNLDILLAPPDMEDLDLIEDAEWRSFLQQIAVQGGYEMVVLDMAEAFRKPETVFGLCSQVVIPFIKDPFWEKRIQALRNCLTEKEGEKRLENLIELELSETGENEAGIFPGGTLIQPAVSKEEIVRKAEEFCFCYERDYL